MAQNESLTLGGIELNDGTTFAMEAFENPPARKRYAWSQGADADGSALVRDPLHENGESTIRVRVVQQATMDLALAKLGQLTGLLEEAENQPGGLPLVWTPAGSTKSLTGYVLSGEIDGLPVTPTGDDAGWFVRSPVVTIKLYRAPFWYGPAVTVSLGSSSTPVLTGTIAAVAGDVPAEARLIVTETGSEARRHLEWGVQQRYYDAATSLLIDSDNLSTTGTAGAGNTRTGAYDVGGGNTVIRATVYGSWQPVASTGALAHVGTYAVKARAWVSSATNLQARLAWQVGDGPLRANPIASIPAAGWVELDLGTVSVRQVTLGTHSWTGTLEAIGTASGETIDIDYLVLVPVDEGYGKAVATYAYRPGVLVGLDGFNGLTAGTALNTRAAPAGGTWATSGASGDFAAVDLPLSTDESMGRSTTADAAGGRFAILGATSYADSVVRVSTYIGSAGERGRRGAVARYVDASNYLEAMIVLNGPDLGWFVLRSVVAGVGTNLAVPALSVGYGYGATYTIQLVAYSSGRCIASLLQGTTTIIALDGYSADAVTGGVLATGKPGFRDENTTATAGARYYDEFSAETPRAEPVVLNAGRQAELRYDAAIRQNPAGTSWGTMPSYRGSRFLLPPAGAGARTSRVLVKANRANVETSPANAVTDALSASVTYTPRYLTVPR